MTCINLFGGPGIGKSTTAATIFAHMKQLNYKVEYIQEFAKDLTYAKDTTRLADQLLILAEQHHRVFRCREQVDYIINDSPLLLGLLYTKEDGHLPLETFNNLIYEIYTSYKNVNILLVRTKEYQQYGRTQTLEQASGIDLESKILLDKLNVPYTICTVDEVLSTVMETISE